MKGLACKEAKNNLSAYLDGELLPELSLKIENHLKACRYCQDDFSQLKGLKESLQSLVSGSAVEPPEFSPEEITAKLPKYEWGIFTDPLIRQMALGVCTILIISAGISGVFFRPHPLEFLTITKLFGEAEEYTQDNLWQPIKPNSLLGSPGLLRTSDKSNLKIQIQNNSGLLLNAKSLLEIRQLHPYLELNLPQGELLVFLAKPHPKVIIQTPSAQIQTLGTFFKVFVGADSTEVKVLEGKVKLIDPVKNATLRIISPREKAMIFNSQPLVAARLLPQEIKMLEEEFQGTNLSTELNEPIIKKKSFILWREVNSE